VAQTAVSTFQHGVDAQQGCATANPLFNAFINIIVEEALNSLGNSCGVEVL
jgi:hypothetical protein